MRHFLKKDFPNLLGLDKTKIMKIIFGLWSKNMDFINR